MEAGPTRRRRPRLEAAAAGGIAAGAAAPSSCWSLGPSHEATRCRRPVAAGAWAPPRLVALAVVVLLVVGVAGLVVPSAQAAAAAAAASAAPASPIHRPRGASSSRWAALGRARGGAAGGRGITSGGTEPSTGSTAAPPGFFTIAERFQALTTADAASDEEDAASDEEEEDVEGEGEGGAKGKGQSPGPGQEESALRAALQYSVVAIVGPQASGKSSLLNALFGTRFPVLDARATGVQRTTRGVWVDLMSSSSRPPTAASTASAAGAPPPLVVLDTEGLESVARGLEGSGLFDRQVSTLAVAAADVILLNLWARDVRGGRLVGGEGPGRGGEEGAGLHAELLRALVQTAAAGGAGADGKEGAVGGRAVSLVVVLRDSEHASGDLAVARDAVRRALEEAAEALGLAASSAAGAAAGAGGSRARGRRRSGQESEEEAGEEGEGEPLLVVAGVRVAFAALPSRVFQPPEFAAAAAGLRDRLLRAVLPPPPADAASSSAPSATTTRLQPVPLPRFPAFAERLWASIVAESGGIVGGEALSTDAAGSSKTKTKKNSPKEERRRRAEEQAQVRAFVRRAAVESCCAEAEPAAGRLERKVEAATEMPILEFGRDADAILQAARRTLRGRLAAASGGGGGAGEEATAAEAEAEAVAALGRRLEPCFRQHVEALGDFYFGKFQDKFLGMYHPAPRLEKEAAALVKDVLGAFDRAAAAAVPADMAKGQGGWGGSVEAARARLKDEMDLEVADRKMEVEVLFPTTDELERAGLGKRFFLRPSWWRKVALKALVIYINYLQTVQAAQSLARAARRRQERYPPMPLF